MKVEAINWAGRCGRFNEEWLLAVLPPGAFIGLELMIAARNRIIRSRPERAESAAQTRPQAA